jgi:hypothetical protein
MLKDMYPCFATTAINTALSSLTPFFINCRITSMFQLDHDAAGHTSLGIHTNDNLHVIHYNVDVHINDPTRLQLCHHTGAVITMDMFHTNDDVVTPALNAIKNFIYNLVAPHPYWDLGHASCDGSTEVTGLFQV